jgi:hypothetical protein
LISICITDDTSILGMVVRPPHGRKNKNKEKKNSRVLAFGGGRTTSVAHEGGSATLKPSEKKNLEGLPMG